jgi:hypothetical protein
VTGKLSLVPRNAFRIERHEEIDLFMGSGKRFVRDTDLVEVVTAADAGLVVLIAEDMVSRPSEDAAKGVADGLDALSRLTADFDVEIHGRLVNEKILDNICSRSDQLKKRKSFPRTPLRVRCYYMRDGEGAKHAKKSKSMWV